MTFMFSPTSINYQISQKLVSFNWLLIIYNVTSWLTLFTTPEVCDTLWYLEVFLPHIFCFMFMIPGQSKNLKEERTFLRGPKSLPYNVYLLGQSEEIFIVSFNTVR
jgi:hypothetical protein